jgi:MFS transporter, PAT family, solute carrier family 33 (acetyl-CoA transportor), member 1
MMCTLPFSLKVLWSPFVDLYYFKSFGRRKSWIIPMQVVVREIYRLNSHLLDVINPVLLVWVNRRYVAS